MDPGRPLDWLLEQERSPDGGLVEALTVFLAGGECPFTCVFCDLWRFTLEGATPAGAIPAQLRQALEAAAEDLPRKSWGNARLKLYNASNFFETGAVPPEDDGAVAALAAPFAQVVVECHPRLVGERCFHFAERLDGRLEVAVGLETVHPRALPRLGKGVTLESFDRAAAALAERQIGLRCFVLLGCPYVEAEETVEWTAASVAHALAAGARQVSIIPVRSGNGALEELELQGLFVPPTLEQLEEVLERTVSQGPGVVTADLWDLERFAPCPACRQQRRSRLDAMNRTGHVPPPVCCGVCGAGGGDG